MAAGDTITQSLDNSLPVVVAAARQVREFEGVMPNLCDKVTLDEGTGQSWREVSMAQLTAQEVTETTRLDNPQQMSDTLFTITPTVVGIQTLVTDRVAARISPKAYAQVGSLAQNAIERKKDEDGLTVARARKIQRFLSQPMFVAEVFTGQEGRYVPIKETVRGFQEILDGKHDDLPEQAFYMVGPIEEAVEKAKSMQAEE